MNLLRKQKIAFSIEIFMLLIIYLKKDLDYNRTYTLILCTTLVAGHIGWELWKANFKKKKN